MLIVKLVHWKASEVEERALILREAGYLVDADVEGGARVFKSLAGDPPAALIIDLSRLPSQGRDFALTVRRRKGSRHIPLVFVDGDAAKVAQVRELLPDAWYTDWESLGETLAEAITNPPSDPVIPDSSFAGYAGKPLVEKLGIKPGSRLSLVFPPAEFEKNLVNLPPGVQISYEPDSSCDLTLWFCRAKDELEAHIADIVAQSHHGPVWIAWPKQKSAIVSDITQQIVRQVGLQNSLVDYKICSIDDTWSGLLFKYREQENTPS